MIEQNERIFSSTGQLGVTRRQDNRLYVNGEYSNNATDVAANFGRLTTIAANYPERISRSVYRGVISDEVFRSITGTRLQRDLEVALPLREFTGRNSWLIYLARNHPGRNPIVPVEEMIGETNSQREITITPSQRVEDVVQSGYNFTSEFTTDDIGQIHELWSETFGWGTEEIENLRRRLERQREQASLNHTVWFSAIRDNDTIVSIAMAERLSVPIHSGRQLDLVESTEWRTRDEYSGRHLMTANLVMLNSQILSDLRMSPNGMPLIFAECNYQSRSDRAANGALFRIPSRRYARQVIRQNVHIGDAASTEKALRDFTPLYLPVGNIGRSYSPDQIDTMLQSISTT